MSIQRYAAFKRVAELGQLTRAASDLGYTQSALSQMISSLEGELGFKLLNRTRRGCTLTKEGAELLPAVEQLMNAAFKVQEKADEINGLETGVVRIGTLASISAHWLPQLIREFETLHPNVQFIIHQGDYTLITQWINEGLIDFGFVNPHGVSGLQTRTVKQGAMSAILPPNHPLSNQERIALQDLASLPFILLEEGCYYEPLEAFHQIGEEPHIKYTIHDDYSIMALVSEGLGVTILADLIMLGCPYELCARPTDPPIFREIALAYKDESQLPIAAKRFMDLVCQRADELP